MKEIFFFFLSFVFIFLGKNGVTLIDLGTKQSETERQKERKKGKERKGKKEKKINVNYFLRFKASPSS